MNGNTPTTRDEVLLAFHEAFDKPTGQQIAEWVERYPQFAEDIRLHATIARDWAAADRKLGPEADDTLLARTFSGVLDQLYKAQLSRDGTAVPTTDGAVQSFHAAMAFRKKTVRILEKELGLAREVFADLFSGRMLAPVTERFKRAVAAALSMTQESFDKAHLLALRSPQTGMAKADQALRVIARPYADIIQDSSMPKERKSYWLGED